MQALAKRWISIDIKSLKLEEFWQESIKAIKTTYAKNKYQIVKRLTL